MDELVEKAQNGDKEAFTDLMLLLKNDLYKIAYARLKNEDDIYDAIQETMIIAFNSIKRLKQPDCFKSWIIKILISQSYNIYRRKSKRKIISLDEVEDYSSANYSNIENIETILDFKFICKNLKYENRMIILLYYMENFTDKEISKILNINENTIKTKRTRALKQIKDIIEGGEKIYG